MATLTEEIILGAVKVIPSTGQVEVQTLSILKREDGTEKSRGHGDSYVLDPGAELADQPQLVQDVANAVWTPTVLEAWGELKKTWATPRLEMPSLESLMYAAKAGMAHPDEPVKGVPQ